MVEWNSIVSPGPEEARRRLATARKEAARIARHPDQYADLGDFASDQASDIAALWQNKRTRKQAIREIRDLREAYANTGGRMDGTSGMTLTRLQARGIPVEFGPTLTDRLRDILGRILNRRRRK